MKFYIYIFPFIFLGNSYKMLAQDKTVIQTSKDTLFFKYDNNYFIKDKHNKGRYYILDTKEDIGSSEAIFFETIGEYENLHPKNI